jgi:hypothetical protein
LQGPFERSAMPRTGRAEDEMVRGVYIQRVLVDRLAVADALKGVPCRSDTNQASFHPEG